LNPFQDPGEKGAMPDAAAPWDAVTEEYDAWVISPFAAGVRFPLRADVRRLLGAWRQRGELERRVVFDLGCGRGDGLALVAGRVGFAVGLDFAPRMLDLSERLLRARGVTPERYRGRAGLARVAAELRAFSTGTGRETRTVLVEGDMESLAPLRHAADLVLAISAISPARPGRAGRVFDQVVSSLKPGGTLMAVLASLDAFLYLAALADRLGVHLPDLGRVDGHGMFHEGGEQQQFFAPADIRRLCGESALMIRTLEKVRYPWPLVRRFGWGYFPGRPRLWDWYLVGRTAARRSARRRTRRRSSP
jgi:SAM-dependent methyltransferase